MAVPDAVVVGGFTETVTIHVRPDDVHLVGVGRPHLRAEDLGPLPIRRLLAVEGAQRFIRLRQRITHDTGPSPVAKDGAATGSVPVAADPPTGRRGLGGVQWWTGPGAATAATAAGPGLRVVGVAYALGGRAAHCLELRLDPIDRVTVARGALPSVAELRQPLERGLILIELQPADECADRVVGLCALLP